MSAKQSVSRNLKFIFHQIGKYIHAIPKSSRSAIIELEGIHINTVGRHISPVIEQSIRSGSYEYSEMQLLKSHLSQNDIVMEIGAGIGFLSSYCAKQIGSERVFAYEANPILENPIRHTYEINHVNPTLEICLVGEKTGVQDFYITSDFWESSFVKPKIKTIETIKVVAKSFNQELERINPSFLIIDIEGGEYELFKDSFFGNVQKIIIEIHNSIIDAKKIQFIKHNFKEAGFQIIQSLPNCEDEILFLQRVN